MNKRNKAILQSAIKDNKIEFTGNIPKALKNLIKETKVNK